jgi:putative membrane protein
MKKFLLFSTTCIAVWMLQSCGGNTNNPQSEKPVDSAQRINETVKPVDEKSSQFAVDAANGSMMEVQMGKLAQEKALHPRVKAFATMMVNDHSKAGDELKALAAKENITLPAELSTKEKKHMDELGKKSGKDFDKAYISMMVEDHDKDVKEFEKASDNVSDENLKTWARNILPTLKAHQDSAKAIQESMKK